MSNKKKIVSKPTIENSSYLYSGDSNKVLLSWIYEKENNTILPVSLTGRKNIKELSEKYHNSSCKSSSKLEFIEDILFMFLMVSFFSSYIIPFVIFTLSTEKLELLLPNNDIVSFIIKSIIFLFTLLVSLFGSLSSIIIWLYLGDRVKENKYNLDKNDREKISQNNFLLISQELPQSLIENAENINKHINKIFSFNDNIIEHVDMTDLQYHYDDYMRLLTFVVTNHESISDELLEKYLDGVDEKSKKVMTLVEDTIKLEEEYTQELEKIRKDKEKLKQEMLDDDALRAYYVE